VGFWRNLGNSLGFGGAEPEQRAAEFGSWPIPGPADGGGGGFSQVDLRRAESNLQSAAVWSATTLVARVLASVPLDTFRETADGARPLPNPKAVEDLGGEGYGTEDWIFQYLMSKQLRGNAVGRVASRDPDSGRPSQIVLYHPDEAVGWRDRTTGAPTWRISGRQVPVDEIWHSRTYPIPGELMGMSPVAYHFLTIGQNLAATRFGLQFFTDSGHPTYVYRNTESTIDPNQATASKAKIMAATHGNREPLVMGKGWDKPEAIQVAPEDSQLLETQGYSAADCCRIFGPGLAEILGYETGGSLTYANRVDRSTDLLTFTFDPWLVQLERLFTSLVPRGQYVRFNRSALLRMTAMDRWKVHEIALRTKARSINEVRDDEDWRPVPWGNDPVEAEKPDPADEIATKVKEAS